MHAKVQPNLDMKYPNCQRSINAITHKDALKLDQKFEISTFYVKNNNYIKIHIILKWILTEIRIKIR